MLDPGRWSAPYPDTFPAPAEPLLAGLRTGEWLDRADLPPLEWVVPGLIPEGFSLLVGGPKIGKSWLALQVALALASGGHVLGRIAVGDPRPVLLFALEDGDRRLQSRARTLLGPRESIPARLHYMTKAHPNDLPAIVEAWLRTACSQADHPLVVLDTVGRVLPPAAPGESAYLRDYKVGARLKAISDSHPGAGLLGLHHDRKAVSDDFVDAVSGTNGLAGAADTLLVLARRRVEAAGLLKVTGRDVTEREYAVATQGGAWALCGRDLDTAAAAAHERRDTENLADRSADVLRFVNANPKGVRAGDVASALGLSGKDAGTYLLRLFNAQRIRRPSRGLYTPVGSVEGVGSNSNVVTLFPTEPTLPTHLQRCCEVCGEPLNPALVEAGEITHPTCRPEGTES